MKATFLNDHELKSGLLTELAWHREQDKLVKGSYGDQCHNGDFRGCAVGCSIHSLNRLKGVKIKTNNHRALAGAVGWPLWLLYLEDRFFEGTPDEYAMQWPERLTRAVPVGAHGRGSASIASG